MDQWTGKVALITGASGGIGSSISEILTKSGLKVIGLGRRMDRLQQLAANLKNAKGEFHPIQCDVTKEKDILAAFEYANRLGGCDILINNAGVLIFGPITESPTENFRKVMDVNVIAMAIFSREAIQSFKKRGTAGHIININSIAGHYAEVIKYPLGLYVASKYAVTALTTGLRHEIEAADLKVRITSISPGAVETDMINQALTDQSLLEKLPKLKDKDIADAVVYALSKPPHVQINEMIISPHGNAMAN